MGKTLLVPDHYPEFKCKCGECRTPCCSGWGISISMKDYFRILGLECSPALRERLDTAISVLNDSTEGRYATLDPDWTGRCKLLRRDDGYCMLQCECGEEAIPEVCRRYPRAYRCGERSEAALANSCEHTLELLFASDEPVKLVEIPVPENFGHIEEMSRLRYDGAEDPALAEEMRKCRFEAMEVISDRSIALCERVAEVIRRTAVKSQEGDVSGTADEELLLEKSVTDILYLMDVLTADSPSLEEETAEVRKIFEAAQNSTGFCADHYTELRAEFDRTHPSADIAFEKMLVNHIFFSGFPYSERNESAEAESIAFAAVYALMKFMNVCLPERDFTDLNAAVFRLIEHSSFVWNAPIVLKQRGIRTAEDAVKLVMAV